MLSDEWLSIYGLLENFNASVRRTRTRTRTGTGTTGVTEIALCTSCSRAKEDQYTLLHTKYDSSGPCGFGEEAMTPSGRGLYGPQGHGWQDL